MQYERSIDTGTPTGTEHSQSARLKRQIAGSFGAQAARYDRHAAFQRICGDRLLSMLGRCQVSRSADLGCGTGYFLPALARYSEKLLALDLSPQMLKQARLNHACTDTYIAADIDNLPLAAEVLELAFSNLVLQWCEDLSASLQQIRRALKPGGRLLFSILLDGSLHELEDSWRKVDDQRHVNRFIPLDELRTRLCAAGFGEIRMEQQAVTMKYATFREIHKDLKGIGANLVVENQQPRSLSRSQVQALTAGYEAFRGKDGLLPMTYQVAWVELTK